MYGWRNVHGGILSGGSNTNFLRLFLNWYNQLGYYFMRGIYWSFLFTRITDSISFECLLLLITSASTPSHTPYPNPSPPHLANPNSKGNRHDLDFIAQSFLSLLFLLAESPHPSQDPHRHIVTNRKLSSGSQILTAASSHILFKRVRWELGKLQETFPRIMQTALKPCIPALCYCPLRI